MSFLAGAECSTSGNPLNQFTKHVQDDKSLQQDRLVGQYQQGHQESFRRQKDVLTQDEVFSLPETCHTGANHCISTTLRGV